MNNNELKNILANALSKASQTDGQQILKKKANRVRLNQEFAKLISLGDQGLKKASGYLDHQLSTYIAYDSITSRVFKDTTGVGTLMAKVQRPEFGAITVPFKGAPANVEVNNPYVTFATHSDSISERVPYDEIVKVPYDSLKDATAEVANAMNLAVDKELFKILATAEDVSPYTPIEVETLSNSIVFQAMGSMSQYSLKAEHAVMNPKTFFTMLGSMTALSLDQDTLQTVIREGHIQQLFGLNFLTSKLCPEGKVYLCADSKYLGTYVLAKEKSVKVADVSWENEYRVSGYYNYGLILHNIPGIYTINIGSNDVESVESGTSLESTESTESTESAIS